MANVEAVVWPEMMLQYYDAKMLRNLMPLDRVSTDGKFLGSSPDAATR